MNSPVKYTDPTGHAWYDPSSWFSGDSDSDGGSGNQEGGGGSRSADHYDSLFQAAGLDQLPDSIKTKIAGEIEASQEAAIAGTTAGLTLVGGLTPGVGEIMDFDVLVDPDYSITEKILAGVSLGISGGTLGFAPNLGGAIKAGRALDEGGYVIGRMKDLNTPGVMKPGEKQLEFHLQTKPSGGIDVPQTYKNNSGALRKAMGAGKPIRDVSPGNDGGFFLNAERLLLDFHGWRKSSFGGGTYYSP